MLRPGEIIVDSFAGGGGASTGIELALGRSPDIAINHDAEAVAMHAANHPGTLHLCNSVWRVRPEEVAAGRPVGLLWASPDCKHFSKAKGGKPVEKNIRDLAWVVVRWARTVRPRVIMLENVEEFRDWGPLVTAEDGKVMPCPLRKGHTFRRFIGELRRLGYKVEHRELRACDYGAPTIRKRLFLIARRDGLPIVWPKPTHGPGLLPYRTAAECIDWSIPCPSIFDRKRPLVENTMARIARGIRRYVLEAARPFIVPVTHAGDLRSASIDEPLRTITTAQRGEHALVAPTMIRTDQQSAAARNGVNSAEDPLRTITTAGGHAVVAPFLAAYYGTGEGGSHHRVADADQPLRTATAENRHALVAAFLAQHNGGPNNEGYTGRAAGAPLSTTTARGTQQQLVTAHMLNLKGTDRRDGPADAPAPSITGQGTHVAEVRAFLLKYYGEGSVDQDCREPLHTVPTKGRFGLVTIEGQDWQIVDIGMRMLSARELFRAQGFPDSYIIDHRADGTPLTKTAQIKACGNSVCPPVAEALVRANFGAAATVTETVAA